MAFTFPIPGEIDKSFDQDFTDGLAKARAELIKRTELEKARAIAGGFLIASQGGESAKPKAQEPNLVMEEALELGKLMKIAEKSESAPELYKNKILRMIALHMAMDHYKGQGVGYPTLMNTAKAIYEFMQSGTWEDTNAPF